MLGGAAELKWNGDVVTTHAALQQYCLARRAVGFRVVIVTLLPRSDPDGFEAARLAYNQLLRDTWPSFADGIIDIAADPRIGDSGDNRDLLFYNKDAVHPNAAGYAVIGSVSAPVILGLEWRSDRCETRIGTPDGLWTEWAPYVPDQMWTLDQGDGPNLLDIEYRLDAQAAPVVSDDIFVDTVAPVTEALAASRVRRGRGAVLRYAVDDALPSSGTAKVTIRITNAAGRLVKTLRYAELPTNAPLEARFVCRLARGKYRFSVGARDAAGNGSRLIGHQTLTVR